MPSRTFFLTATPGGQPFTEALKNHFKALDAVRDILDWHAAGHAFTVSVAARRPAPPPPLVVAFAAVEGAGLPRPAGEAERVIETINAILNRLAAGEGFDLEISRADGPPTPLARAVPGLN
ncbi:MAG: hypothetical protein HY719_01195 [Planctomycetes bacterium]|nr:hypothetical protein [Planctomycetota bacterium]